MTIGQKIKKLREESGMLQRELAHALEIGEGFLSKVERNQKSLKRTDLAIISKLFNIDLDELESLWLGNKVYEILKDEEQGLAAMKIAENRIMYNKKTI